jgi:hypothetical protein
LLEKNVFDSSSADKNNVTVSQASSRKKSSELDILENDESDTGSEKIPLLYSEITDSKY